MSSDEAIITTSSSISISNNYQQQQQQHWRYNNNKLQHTTKQQQQQKKKKDNNKKKKKKFRIFSAHQKKISMSERFSVIILVRSIGVQSTVHRQLKEVNSTYPRALSVDKEVGSLVN